jgi:hypothetical protein
MSNGLQPTHRVLSLLIRLTASYVSVTSTGSLEQRVHHLEALVQDLTSQIQRISMGSAQSLYIDHSRQPPSSSNSVMNLARNSESSDDDEEDEDYGLDASAPETSPSSFLGKVKQDLDRLSIQSGVSFDSKATLANLTHLSHSFNKGHETGTGDKLKGLRGGQYSEAYFIPENKDKERLLQGTAFFMSNENDV